MLFRSRIAEATGTTKSSVVREAVVRYLEDREDAALAAQVKKAGGASNPLPQSGTRLAWRAEITTFERPCGNHEAGKFVGQ